ncbi:MAG: DNA-binding response regulator [Desulfuromonadales bacterium GWC2_61_20]|nr:MAG: DNA-binding response regulator [Desulfuromonadales bacterium GWC2_61_20]HAD03774.1 DNA-binding response regulator [Desulfuromonas sp.]
MPKIKILAIEDEEDILALVHYNLTRDGYEVLTATSGEDGLALARQNAPQLVLLDLMLPGMDGLEVCRQLKRTAATESIPVIMLTAKGEEADVVAGLELGADDYVSKPFSARVLLSRIRAVLRRHARKNASDADKDVIEIGTLRIHLGRNEALVEGAPVELTFSEFRVLCCLARRPGWVFTRSQIIDAVRGDDYAVTERAVDVQIVGLRRKLGSAGRYIETVRGVGYRFKDA